MSARSYALHSVFPHFSFVHRNYRPLFSAKKTTARFNIRMMIQFGCDFGRDKRVHLIYAQSYHETAPVIYCGV